MHSLLRALGWGVETWVYLTSLAPIFITGIVNCDTPWKRELMGLGVCRKEAESEFRISPLGGTELE